MSFDDISTHLFDSDNVHGRRSEAIPLSGETWQLFLFCRQNWDVYELESAFEMLQTYCLIQWEADQRSYSMHKLVHTWGYDRLEVDQQQRLNVLALDLMADATARRGISRSDQVRLVPHVVASFRAFSRLHGPLDGVTQGVLNLIDRMGGLLYRIGKWSVAHELRIFRFTKTKMMLGGEHPETLTSKHNLARLSCDQGDYQTAERIHREELALSEQVLGEEHPDILMSKHSLAQVLSKQGDYKAAEPMHR